MIGPRCWGFRGWYLSMIVHSLISLRARAANFFLLRKMEKEAVDQLLQGMKQLQRRRNRGGRGGIYPPQLYRVELLLAVTNRVVHYNQRERKSDDINSVNR